MNALVRSWTSSGMAKVFRVVRPLRCTVTVACLFVRSKRALSWW